MLRVPEQIGLQRLGIDGIGPQVFERALHSGEVVSRCSLRKPPMKSSIETVAIIFLRDDRSHDAASWDETLILTKFRQFRSCQTRTACRVNGKQIFAIPAKLQKSITPQLRFQAYNERKKHPGKVRFSVRHWSFP